MSMKAAKPIINFLERLILRLCFTKLIMAAKQAARAQPIENTLDHET